MGSLLQISSNMDDRPVAPTVFHNKASDDPYPETELTMKNRCPDEESLADYAAGRLSVKERSLLDAHLSDCDACLEDLVLTRQVVTHNNDIQIEPVPFAVQQNAMNLVSRLNLPIWHTITNKTRQTLCSVWRKASDTLLPDFMLSHPIMAIRGDDETVSSDDSIRVKQDFGGIHAEIEVEYTSHNALIRVSLSDTSRKERISMSLKKEGREIAYLPLNQETTVFDEILPGCYHLCFFRYNDAIGTYALEIREPEYEENI